MRISVRMRIRIRSAGLVINLLGRIPEDGERPSVTVDGILFTVTKIEERRIVRIMAERILRQEEETEKDA